MNKMQTSRSEPKGEKYDEINLSEVSSVPDKPDHMYKVLFSNLAILLRVDVQTCNPNNSEAGTGGLPYDQGQSRLHSDYQAKPGYKRRFPSLKQKNKIKA